MTDRVKQAIEEKDAIQALLNSQGWHILSKIIEIKVAEESEYILLSPLGDKYKDAYQQEFAKGNVHGMKVVQLIAKTVLETAEAIVEQEMTNVGTDDRTRDELTAEQRHSHGERDPEFDWGTESTY